MSRLFASKTVSKPIVLVIDDEHDIAETLKAYIEESGRYSACSANSAESAFTQLKKHERFLGLGGNKIACIVLDIKMPEISGLEFLKKFRDKEPFFQMMPVILLSAYEDAEKWQQATSPIYGNVSEYLIKPVNKQNLVETIDRIIAGETGYMIDYTREKKKAERIKILNRRGVG